MSEREPRRWPDEVSRGIGSPFWRTVSESYERKLREKQTSLEGCDDQQLRRIQGWCAALKWALRQPEEILRKLREDAERDNA